MTELPVGFETAAKREWQTPELENLGTGIGDVAGGTAAVSDGMEGQDVS